ncbi:MAG: hypothetical protein GC201_16110 [Alphaproteobacteria bacterium]|nr:hypothetical protein [Alphaproteobacteria bacterium]
MITWIRRYLSDRTGAIAVEFAVLSPFIAILIVGAWDMARYINDQAALTEATRSGLQYAVSKYWNADLVKAAVLAEASREGLDNVSVTVNSTCDCPNGTTPSSCTATNACGGTNALRVYTEIQATKSYATTIDYRLVPQQVVLNRSSSLRVR